MTDVNVFSQIRGAVRQFFQTAQLDISPTLGDGAELLIAESLPPLATIVKEGNSWQSALTTGLAATTALPTTTAGISINNFETGPTPKSLVIEEFGSYQSVIDATQIDSTLLVAMNNKRGSAQASAGTVLGTANIQSLSGKGSYGGNAVIRSGATVANDGWYPHGQDFTSQSPTLAGMIFQANVCRVRGLYIVPPGGSFSVQAIKSAAAAAAQQFFFIRWHEVCLNLG